MPIFNYSVAFLCIVYRSSLFLGGLTSAFGGAIAPIATP